MVFVMEWQLRLDIRIRIAVVLLLLLSWGTNDDESVIE